MQDRQDFAIYLHWPFCESKCPYCDFNSHVALRVDQSRWAAAFETEIARLASETLGRTVSSVYFGGGTPSLMLPETVDRILTAVRKGWGLRNDVEITLEANPGSVEAGRFAGYRAVGVNRISMGFQALDNHALRQLGRLHDTSAALKALETARAVFDRVSFDLIYARQNQTMKAWEAELRQALDLGPQHLSLYQLTIEDGTAFAQRFAAGALRGLPDESLSVGLFDLTQEMCEAADLPAYEVSNHAVPGQESLHNLTYWRGGDYLGIGPGAHGRITHGGRRFATTCHRLPTVWLQRVDALCSGEDHREELSSLEWAEEMIMMSLRTSEGIDLETLFSRTGKTIGPEAAKGPLDLGLIRAQDHRLQATRAGRLVLNGVIRELASALD